MDEQLIGEAITPIIASMDASRSAPGEPAPPMRFLWRKREYVVEQVLRKWRETGPCRNGSGERYVRKHWFEVRVAGGHGPSGPCKATSGRSRAASLESDRRTDSLEMKIFFERQPRSARDRIRRWWLYTVRPPAE